MIKIIISLVFVFLFSFPLNSQTCKISFDPPQTIFTPQETYNLTLCFKDYTEGIPQYEKASWEDLLVNYTADGTTPVWKAIGNGNTLSSAYCIKVSFVAGSVDSISISAKATGNTNGCVKIDTNTYYTNLISVINDQKEENIFKINNLFNTRNGVHFSINSYKNENYNISVLSIDGKIIFSQYFSTIKGNNEISLPLSTQYSGIAILKVKNNKSSETKKIFIDI